jgi:site-specific DNA recombinase
MDKYVCTACKHKIPRDTLDAIFASEVQRFALAPFSHAENMVRIQEAHTLTTTLIATHSETIRKTESQIDSLLSLHHSKSIDEAGFKKRYQPLQERTNELNQELAKLTQNKATLTRQLSLQQEATTETIDIAARYDTLTFTEKRKLVEAVIEKVVIGDGEVSFTYLFDPK